MGIETTRIRVLIVVVTMALALIPQGPARAAVCQGLDGGPGDLDGDGLAGALDCNDGDPELRSLPGEVLNVRGITVPANSIYWEAPADLGGSGPVTYEVLRSLNRANFETDPSATCLDVAGQDLSATDAEVPPPGGAFYYLPRARNGCGPGSLGFRSDGIERAGRECNCSALCDDGDSCTEDGCSDGSCIHAAVAPDIVREPASIAVCTGDLARFSVAATGSGALTYQWYKDGGPVGSNSPVLELPAVQGGDGAAQIQVLLTDGCAAPAFSATAILTVFADSASCAGGLDGQEPPNGRRSSRLSVSLHSGEFQHRVADLYVAGRGFGFAWKRTYRSREWRSSAMGVGWTHSYDRQIEFDPQLPGNILVHTGDSRIDSYAPSGGGCLTAPGFFRELCPQPVPPGSYALTLADKTVWKFAPLDLSPAAGRIFETRDRNGNTMSFSYDVEGRLAAITDTLGREIEIAYNARDLVESVTDFTGRQVRYAYYNGLEQGGELDDLKSVTSPAVLGTPTGNDFPDGKTTVYTYSQGFLLGQLNHNLLTITEPDGNVVLRNTYTDSVADQGNPRFDRLDRQELPGDGVITYVYVPQTPTPVNNLAVSKTIVKDGAGNVGEYLFDAERRLVVARQLTGRAPQASLPTGELSNRPLDPLRPDDPPVYETRWEYNADFLPVRGVAPGGSEVQWSYDSDNPDVRLRGNLLQRTRLPGLLGGDQLQIIETWQYDTDFGTVWSAHDRDLLHESVSLSAGHDRDLLHESVSLSAGHGGDLLHESVSLSAGHGGDLLHESVSLSAGHGGDLLHESVSLSAGHGGDLLHESVSLSANHGGDLLHESVSLSANHGGDLLHESVSLSAGHGGDLLHESVSLSANHGGDLLHESVSLSANHGGDLLHESVSLSAGHGGDLLHESVSLSAGHGGDLLHESVSLSAGRGGDLLHESVSLSAGHGGDLLHESVSLSAGHGGDLLHESVSLSAGHGGDLLHESVSLSAGHGGDLLHESVSLSAGHGGDLLHESVSLSVAGGVAFPSSYTDGRGNTYTMQYDASGNLVTLTAPLVITGVLGGGNQAIQHAWAYNPSGQITQYTSPDNRVDQLTYYASGPENGYLEQVILDQPNLALATTFKRDPLGRLTQFFDPARSNPTDIVFNALDQVVRVTRIDAAIPAGNWVDRYHDANDRLIRVDVQSVDEAGQLRQNAWLTKRYLRDDQDRIVRTESEIDSPACIIEEYEYDANGNVALWRKGEAVKGNQPTNTVSVFWDERDLPFRTVRAEGNPGSSTSQYDYDLNADLAAVRTGLETGGPHVTTVEHDGYGRTVRRIDAEDNETTLHYDANGNLISLRHDGEESEGVSGLNIRLYETSYQYDEANRRVRADEQHFVTATGGPIGDGVSTDRVFYNPSSRVVRIEDDNAHATTVQYDTARRIETVADARGNTKTYAYDATSNVTRITEVELSDLGGPPETFITDYAYDVLDRRTAVEDSLGNIWQYAYDSRNDLTQAVDSRENVSRHVYDGIGRLTRIERDLTDTGTGAGTVIDTVGTSRAWDDSSRLASVTDDNGNATTYAYDALDRPVSMTLADGTVRSATYDAHDNPVAVTDANGSVIVSIHDALDRLVERTISRAPGVSGTTSERYRYDGRSRLVRAQDDDTVVSRTYDSSSPLLYAPRLAPWGRTGCAEGSVRTETTEIAGGPDRIVQATHDGVGNRLTLVYPSGLEVITVYDALDRPAMITDGGGELIASYDYVGPHRIERITRPNGMLTDHTYDGARRLVRKKHHDGVSIAAEHTFAWDAASNQTTWADELPGGATHTYDYDSLDRLIASAVDVPAPVTIDYTLDGVGNRATVAGGPDAGAYTRDPTLPEPADYQVDQYTTTPTGGRSYDRNGNTTALAAGAPGAPSMIYDWRNQIVETTDGLGTMTYRYDALGRRVERSGGGEPVQWLTVGEVSIWDGGDAGACYSSGVVEMEEYFLDGGLRASYLYGAAGERLQVREADDLDENGSLDSYSYHSDDVGSVVAVTDASGAVAERYAYGDYGSPLFFDGAGGPLAQSLILNPYLFLGLRFDGTWYSCPGYLDPAAGRHLTRGTGDLWLPDLAVGR